jgi:hypothetical protein
VPVDDGAKCTIKEASTMDNNRNDSDETGQMRRDQIERLSRLEAENARLKDELAVLTLDNLILGEVVEESGSGGVRK